jgi:hypothetical protein
MRKNALLFAWFKWLHFGPYSKSVLHEKEALSPFHSLIVRDGKHRCQYRDCYACGTYNPYRRRLIQSHRHVDIGASLSLSQSKSPIGWSLLPYEPLDGDYSKGPSSSQIFHASDNSFDKSSFFHIQSDAHKIDGLLSRESQRSSFSVGQYDKTALQSNRKPISHFSIDEMIRESISHYHAPDSVDIHHKISERRNDSPSKSVRSTSITIEANMKNAAWFLNQDSRSESITSTPREILFQESSEVLEKLPESHDALPLNSMMDMVKNEAANHHPLSHFTPAEMVKLTVAFVPALLPHLVINDDSRDNVHATMGDHKLSIKSPLSHFTKEEMTRQCEDIEENDFLLHEIGIIHEDEQSATDIVERKACNSPIRGHNKRDHSENITMKPNLPRKPISHFTDEELIKVSDDHYKPRPYTETNSDTTEVPRNNRLKSKSKWNELSPSEKFRKRLGYVHNFHEDHRPNHKR